MNDLTPADLHLWEIDHPYYASDGCYYLARNRWGEAHGEWESWADFHEAWGDSDMDYNLLYRWDWERADPSDYDEDDVPTDKLRLFYMLQRKAKPHSHCIDVTEADEPAVRAWLAEHAEHLRAVWEPLLGERIEAKP